MKLPDPLYSRAKQEAENKDTSIGAIIREWKVKADAHTYTMEEHRLADAEPTTPREDAPWDESGDPENL